MDTLATTEMATYCFQVILSRLQSHAPPAAPHTIPNTNCPIFVTLKTLPHDHLRGCIGNFSPSPLHEQLSRYAIAAAFEDTRFSPVKLTELPSLACSVSLLHSFEPTTGWDDWVIGTHGIRVRYQQYSATFLPSVASEQGWDHATTLRHLLAKAGFRGAVNDQVLREMIENVGDAFERPPPERLRKQKDSATEKKRHLKQHMVDQAKQDDWIARARQGVHCSLFCSGSKCRLENWDSLKESEKRACAIEGLNSNWVGDDVIASQRPSTSLFVKYPLIQQFHAKQVTGVLNLQEKGEHGSCGPDGIYPSSGYSYNGAEDLMPHGISYYEFPWPDMTAPQQDVVLRSVQVMDYHIKNEGKVLVHCHAGLGRTGLMIACYYVFSQHLPSTQAIKLVREGRPGAIQTKRQAEFISDFEKHLWRLAQAFRVEISDALLDVSLFTQRQRIVLHGEQADLYKHVPKFLHIILCRLLNLTRGDSLMSLVALQSLGPSSTPDVHTLAACRVAINRLCFKVQNISDVSILSFLVCDWFRSMSSPALSIADCDAIVAFKRRQRSSIELDRLPLEIRKMLCKPIRHTLGMVISAFSMIAACGVRESVKVYAFRCLTDSFSHAFNPIKVRHSPMERDLVHEFLIDWATSIGDLYFNYDAVPSFHHTLRQVALASSVVLPATASSASAISPSAPRPRRIQSHVPQAPTFPAMPFSLAQSARELSSSLESNTPRRRVRWAKLKKLSENSLNSSSSSHLQQLSKSYYAATGVQYDDGES